MENTNTKEANEQPLFTNINAESPITEIESLCMNCQENGMTRLMTTKIPYFKDIIIMSFTCDHCGFKNSEIEMGGELPDQGIKFTLTVASDKDLNRQVIKSNYATINIPMIGLEIPPSTQKGRLSTVEGFLMSTRDNFQESIDSGYYSEMGEDFLTKIKAIIAQLTDCLEGKKYPFEFILDDPSGKSFIENPYAPQSDQGIKLEFYNRTKEMAEAMGYSLGNQIQENTTTTNSTNSTNKFVDPSYYNRKNDFEVYKSKNEFATKIIDFTKSIDEHKEDISESIYDLPVNCSCCYKPGFNHNCICTIPYFKEIIISCFKCEFCGFKHTDIQGGGGISEKASKFILKVNSQEDLNRDLFKSETSKIIIPEIGFESSEGSLGSMFTTVEGVLDKIIENIENSPFIQGDSAESKEKFDSFIERIKGLKCLKEKFTFIMDDISDNSFIFPVGNMEPSKDTGLIKEVYERSEEQNEVLGINQMKVD